MATSNMKRLRAHCRTGRIAGCVVAACSGLVASDADAIDLVYPNGHFLNAVGQSYPTDPRLQYDSRLIARFGPGGAVVIGDQWVLHQYHAANPDNPDFSNTTTSDRYVGKTMNLIDNSGNAIPMVVVQSRENGFPSVDWALLRVERAGSPGQHANLPIWADRWGEIDPEQVRRIHGSYGFQLSSINWGTIPLAGEPLLTDVSTAPGDSGSGIFAREGFNLELDRSVRLAPVSPTPQGWELLNDWIGQMGDSFKPLPLQVGTYSTAALSTTGTWSSSGNWNNGVPTSTSIAWIDNSGSISINGTASAKGIYVGVGSGTTLSGVGHLDLANGAANLTADSIILAVEKEGTNISAGTLTQRGGTVTAGSEIIGYRGSGRYIHSGGTNTVSGSMIIGRDAGSAGHYEMNSLNGVPTLAVGTLTVGRAGNGTFAQSAGTVNVANDVHVGKLLDSTGLYSLSGGTLNVQETLWLGKSRDDNAQGFMVVTGGNLTTNQTRIGRGFFIQSGGSTIHGYLQIDSEGVYSISGGSVTIVNSGIMKSGGVLNFNSASVTMTANGIVDLSAGTITTGQLATLNAGSTSLIIFSNDQFGAIGNINDSSKAHYGSGTITIASNRTVIGHADIANHVSVSGTLSASAGHNINLNGGVTVSGLAQLGGGDLRYTSTTSGISAGTLTGHEMRVGKGTFTHTGGSAFWDSVSMNQENTNRSLYQLSAGTLTAGSLTVYGSTFNQVGGIATFAVVNLNGPGTAFSGPEYALTGGTLSVDTFGVVGNGSFTQSSGSASVGTLLNFGSHAHSGGSASYGSINNFGISSGTVTVSGGTLTAGSIQQVTLAVNGNALVMIDPAVSSSITSKVNHVSFDGGSNPGGTLDLNQDKLIIDYTGSSPLTTVNALLKHAYDTSEWEGTGITSSDAAADPASYALGIGEAGAMGIGTFGGISVDSTSLLIAFTWAGDADLDGDVDQDDVDILTQNMGKIEQYWYQGDFNYDGIVNRFDQIILEANEGQGGLFTSVPEPGAVGLLVFTALFTIRRRKLDKIDHA